MDTTRVPGHTRLLPTRADLDSLGHPVLYAAAVGGIGSDYVALSWQDSAWVQRWNLGFHVAWFGLVDAPLGRHPLIWQTYGSRDAAGQIGPAYLVMSEDLGNTYATPDTIAPVDDQSFFYEGALSQLMRWAVKVDWRQGMRLFSSDTAGRWREYLIQGNSSIRDVLGVAMQTLDDTSVVVVWTQSWYERLHWGVLRGNHWEEKPAPPFTTTLRASTVRLRQGVEREFWVSWAESRPHVRVTRFQGEIWSVPESLYCAYRLSGHWHANAPYLSDDTLRYPVVAWTASNEDRGAMNTLCLCVPSDSGEYPVAENLEGTDGIAQAAMTRDANEDIWVAWWNDYLEGMFWTHSVVRATASALWVERGGSKPLLRWTLTEPAPGSWWTVLRADGDGPFEAAGRIRAGSDSEMTWADDRPVHGHVRYQIRRDCVDKRYEWLSEEARWPAKSRKPSLSLSPRPLDSSAVPFKVGQAAAGPLVIELYDIQGRRLLRRTEPRSGLDIVSVSLDLTQLERRLTSGIYFLRVTDAAGQQSEAVKVVVLR